MTGLGYTADELVELLTPYFVLRGAGSWTWGFWSSTSWDGDAKAGADGIIDLSAVFSLPAGIKAISLRFSVKDATVGTWGRVSVDSTDVNAGVIVRAQVANIWNDTGGIVQCDTNGDIYFAQSAALDGVELYINGYLS